MVGLIYLSVAALYLSLMFFVVRWAWRKGRINNGSNLKALSYAFIGFLVIYLPAFWNLIPVIWVHRNLCNMDAGFVAYTTPEKWVAENKMHLSSNSVAEFEKLARSEFLSPDRTRYEILSGLLTREQIDKTWQQYGINFHRVESRFFDIRKNILLTKRVDYTAGSREDPRIWLTISSCFPSSDAQPVHQENSFIFKIKEGIK